MTAPVGAATRGACVVVQPSHASGVERLEAAGLTVRTLPDHDEATVLSAMPEALAVVTRAAGLSAAAMEAAPRLRVVGNHGVGVDPIDVGRATELGIPVVNTPDANTQSVIELTIGLMLAVLRRLPAADAAVRRGDARFKYVVTTRELAGATVGIVGYGRIGRGVASVLATAFGCRVLARGSGRRDEDRGDPGVTFCDLDTLLSQSDVVTLHAPATVGTLGLLGAAEIALMRPGAVLINTARGALVDERALADAVRSGHLAGAGLDVFEREGSDAGAAFRDLDAVVLSPHTGGSTVEAQRRTALAVAEAVLRVLVGDRPESLVNPAVWLRRRT